MGTQYLFTKNSILTKNKIKMKQKQIDRKKIQEILEMKITESKLKIKGIKRWNQFKDQQGQ